MCYFVYAEVYCLWWILLYAKENTNFSNLDIYSFLFVVFLTKMYLLLKIWQHSAWYYPVCLPSVEDHFLLKIMAVVLKTVKKIEIEAIFVKRT